MLKRRGPQVSEVQLRYATKLTDRQYVCQRAWETATLSSCPLHPKGGCGFARHTGYVRKSPPGARIARYYCRKAKTTFSLLPDCLASRLSGSLGHVETAVAVAESSRTLTEAAAQLRPDLADVRHALRWLRRRTEPVRAALTVLVTLLPAVTGVQPTVASVRESLGVPQALVVTRELMSEQLRLLRHPVGLRPRVGARPASLMGLQQKVGPDPPSGIR